jgi:hypothetical protein
MVGALALDVVSFQIEKDGNTRDECEDAFSPWPVEPAESSAHTLRLGVADGATESAFSRQWAELLAAEMVKGPLFTSLFRPGRDWRPGLSHIRRAWHDGVNRGDLPWYLEQKIDEGAFATVLGVQFTERASRNWTRRTTHLRAVAVGDTCLFHVRGGTLVRGFPLGTAKAFNSRPCLVGTRPVTDHALIQHIHRHQATYVAGDRFYLATDALAHFVLTQVEQGVPVWDQIDEVVGDAAPGAFGDWVNRVRGQGLMRNDDVTLVKIVAK